MHTPISCQPSSREQLPHRALVLGPLWVDRWSLVMPPDWVDTLT